MQGEDVVHNNSGVGQLKNDAEYHICGQAAAIRAALNLHKHRTGRALHDTGIKREVLAWIEVSGAQNDYRHFGVTEDIGGAPNLATSRNRCKEYEPDEARRRFRNAFDREKQTCRIHAQTNCSRGELLCTG